MTSRRHIKWYKAATVCHYFFMPGTGYQIDVYVCVNHLTKVHWTHSQTKHAGIPEDWLLEQTRDLVYFYADSHIVSTVRWRFLDRAATSDYTGVIGWRELRCPPLAEGKPPGVREGGGPTPRAPPSLLKALFESVCLRTPCVPLSGSQGVLASTGLRPADRRSQGLSGASAERSDQISHRNL